MTEVQRPRPQQAVKSHVPPCGQYKNMTVGLLPEDYASVEREAAAIGMSNSQWVRDLIHDRFHKEN